MASAESSSAQVQYKKISSKVIPGVLNSLNKGAIDWGWQGLLAYGCQHVVVVVDCANVQILQTLDKHQSCITKVKWPSESYYCNQIYPYTLKLASADASGNVIIWNVKDGKMLCQLSDGSKPVLEMHWLSLTITEGGYDMLAVLHPPYSFIVWNVQTGTKLWKKTYTESLLGFSLDPFCSTNLAFLGHDCIVLVDDFTLSKVPSSNGKKFYISCPSALSTSTTNLTNVESDDKPRTRDKLKKKVRLLGGADNKASRSEESSSNVECLSFGYHPACRHHLLLVYPREVLILDLEINQTVGIITVERTGSPFVQVIALSQRDAICGLHENGVISLHLCQTTPTAAPLEMSTSSFGADNYVEVVYDTKAQSDPIRLTKLHRVVGLTVSPQTEANVALLISDGRVMTWDLKPRYQPTICSPMPTLSGLIPPVYGIVNKNEVCQLKFVLSGILQTAASPPLVARMCPPLTTKNWNLYEPWMAAGATSGAVQIFDMAAGMLHKELCVHTYPVRGIEWVSLTAFLSYAHQNMGNSTGHVRNELFLTDVQTGKSKSFRSENREESPIDMIRVSHLKQYFIVAFKDDPFELWDIRNLTLLRAMTRKFPTITALEWAPINNLRSLKKKMHSAMTEQSNKEMNISILIGPPSTATESRATIHPTNILIKESFLFADTDGHIYQFMVEGSVIKDGNKLPPDNSIGSVTSISWKGEQLVMGDVDGNLSLWDLKSKYFKVVPTHRGWIKRVRFAPGRGNMKVLVLYNDGVDIWDARDSKLLGQVKSPKDMPRVEDADWAASDKPVVVTSDGCLRIMDLFLLGSSSPLMDRECLASFWCPALLPSAMLIRTLLLHSRWNDKFALDEFKEKFNSDQMELLKSHVDIGDKDLKNCFKSGCPLSSVHHYLMVARLLGDEGEVKFWEVAQHYLQIELKSREDCKAMANCQLCRTRYLDGNYDILCDSDTYKKIQLDRLALHESKQTNHEHACKCADTLILLRETDRAVQHLLETDPSSEDFYTDCLRACIVASVQSSSISQSTIKLVATSLIANGYISEGVQLLCLIGKGVDACRYLQTYGKWEKAMWLAKSTLNEAECLEVARRWTDHLISPQIDQRGKAILVLLSVQQFTKVLEMLLSWSYTDRAALFADVCNELKVLRVDESTSQLLKDIYLKYSRFLHNEGNKLLARYYATKADDVGELGQQGSSANERCVVGDLVSLK